MITIRVILEGEFVKKINIDGHAQYDSIGKDIICAGVSALYFSTEASLKTLIDKRNIFRLDSHESGKAEIEFLRYESDSQLLAKSLLTGLRLMERNYDEFVYIEEVNINGS